MMVTAIITAPLQAQTYPHKPIRILVPFPPGDTLDTLSRLIAPRLAERLGQAVIIDNRAGGAGQIALGLAATAAPDGYTLVGGQGGNLVVQPHTYRNLPYDPLRDFAPIANSARNFMGLVVNAGGRYRSVDEFLAFGRANPGTLSFGSIGEGGFSHLAFEMLRMQAGFTYLHVPYRGSAQVVTEILGNRVDATIMGIASLTPFVRAGRLRLLAVTGPSRAAAYPEVPALAELLPGYESRGWFGYLAPAGTPRTIVARLNAEINRAFTTPEVREKIESLGMNVIAESPEAFARTLRDDYEKYGKLVRAIGLRPQ
jgi:tripartite-type tricarboxylate transporter receptor subunit TctC